MSMADDNTFRSYRRNTQPSGEPGGGDPLAELARLLGQNDPFGDYGQGNRRSDGREPQHAARKTSDWRKTAAAMPAYDSYPEETVPSAPRTEQHFAADEFPRHDPYQMATAVGGHDRRQYPEPFHPRQDDRAYAAPSYEARAQQQYFEDGAPMAPDDEDTYDDPPRARRRGGLITAVVLIGCAMIATASAYGYRTYYALPN